MSTKENWGLKRWGDLDFKRFAVRTAVLMAGALEEFGE